MGFSQRSWGPCASSARWLVAAAALALMACGSRGTVVGSAPALTVAPATADFGTRPPTSRNVLTLTITNSTSAAIDLAGAVLQGDTRNVFSGGLLPPSVPASGSITYNLTYAAPAMPGSDQATLSVRGVGSATPLQIPVTGRTGDASCSDQLKNGDESDVDCGGSKCPPCGASSQCAGPGDCAGGLACVGGKCGACTQASDCRPNQQCTAGGACVGCQHDSDCAAGSTCSNGACAVCPGATGTLDTTSDPNNCGRCGNVCPQPSHSTALCIASQCGRGPCDSGWYDLDSTFGCESTCNGHVCTSTDGGTVTVTNDPLPETGNVFRALSSGSSYGGGVQTGPTFTNNGALGESTPPPLGGAVRQSSTHYQNVGGMKSTLH